MDPRLKRVGQLLEISKNHRAAWRGAKKRSEDDHQRTKITTMGLCAITTFAATATLIISFSAPNWMESRTHAYSEFVNLGLWEFCFNNYLHHSFQFHHAFTGCHWGYSQEFWPIREFIMPPWFLAVQGLVTVSLILSLISTISIAVTWKNFLPKYQIGLLKSSIIQNITAALLLLVSIIIFGIKAQEQRWMPNQLYNYYSWSYWMAFISLLFHLISAFLIRKKSKNRRSYQTNQPTATQSNVLETEEKAYGEILSTVIISDAGKTMHQVH